MLGHSPALVETWGLIESRVRFAYLQTDRDFLKTMLKISSTSVLSLNDVWYSGDDADKISIGEMLPSERELALRLGVSRPVVHDGLMENSRVIQETLDRGS